MAYSSSVRHSLGGINTFGSLIPIVRSKNDSISLPYFGLEVIRDIGRHPWYVHVPIYERVSFVGNVKLPPLCINENINSINR